MSGAGVRIGVGTRVMYDGALHEVTEWLPTVSGTDVVLRGPSSVCRMSVVELVSSARVRLLLETAGPESTDDIVPAAVLLSSLSKEELAEIRGKAAHVREVLTGFRSGSADIAQEGEPRPHSIPAARCAIAVRPRGTKWASTHVPSAGGSRRTGRTGRQV